VNQVLSPILTDITGTAVTPVTKLDPGVRGVASAARPRKRHILFILSFILLVPLPTIVAAFYLYTVAADQFSSRVSFSIRSEDFTNPLDALGSLGQLSTGTSSDARILNEYIRSQKILEDMSKSVDLETIYTVPEFDPVFAMQPDQPIENILTYWKRMTHITYDSGSGLIDVETFAFTPEDATDIATSVMDASSRLVEMLSNIARDDTIRHAQYELTQAQDRLTSARTALGELRDREQIIDPRIDLESRMGVVTALEQKLANALVEYDLLIGTTLAGDRRRKIEERTIAAIKDRIVQERNKIGHSSGQQDGASLSNIVGDYETLQANREFAERAYVAAAASYDSALAEARRKSRYLAAHIPPTMAQSAENPKRLALSLGVFGACFLLWMIGTLTVYAMLDRR
jgi:capsular polysaccharide transport system permease protein